MPETILQAMIAVQAESCWGTVPMWYGHVCKHRLQHPSWYTPGAMYEPKIPTRAELDSMSAQDHKVVENRLRRAAERQGLGLEKSRARDPRASTSALTGWWTYTTTRWWHPRAG